MADDLYFNVVFGSKSHLGDDLTMEENFLAADESLDIIEVLTFFAANPISRSNEIDDLSLEIYKKKYGDVVKSFINSARDRVSEIEKRRKDLEKLVSLSLVKIK